MLKNLKFIPVNTPKIFGSERYLINKCLKTGWISSEGSYVKQFESTFAKFNNKKYGISVSNGTAALEVAIKSLNLNKGDEVIVPSFTIISSVLCVVKNGLKPILVDTDINNWNMCVDQVLKKINKKTLAVFITHAQGFNGLNDHLLKELKKRKIHLIEDVCESHGAKHKNKKLGSYGLVSNFSFYYAHHMTTIEGGMICTNDKKIFEISKMLRSHGMVREAKNNIFEKKMINKYKDLSQKFIFLYPTLNFRNNEIGATIGLNQLKSLNKNNKKRTVNFTFFLKHLDPKKYFVNFDLIGSSNYAFPLILNTKSLKVRDKFEKYLITNNIEFRRGNAGGGNQLRQPYIKEFIKIRNFSKFKNVEHIHFFGYYIGNYPDLTKEKIVKILRILNNIKF